MKQSEILSARSVQPGHHTEYRATEETFYRAALKCLDVPFKVTKNPKDLINFYGTKSNGNRHGIAPDAKLENTSNGKLVFVEVKRQGSMGNAHERAYRHHTVQFYKEMSWRYGYDYHPYVSIFCEDLATKEKYTSEIAGHIEPSNYYLWVDYNRETFDSYIKNICESWLV